MFQLEIQNECSTDIPEEQWLAKCASLAYEGEGDASAVLRVVERDEAQTLNRSYRGKDYATNVLSFPSDFSDLPQEVLDGEDTSYLGDLVVCAAVVAEEAKQQHKALQQHWAHLVIHGLLHLQGYDHIDDDEALIMEKLEVSLLEQIGVPDPYGDADAN
ncbi:MAG: rRNA maturation RNase YbeY [Proteobacteria bacterium]|nr:MAG: rRNA maturation RNase YbeY [Pseudomonadota bacterium]